jgi:F0F1-type ATP synthase epsilon subunit
MNRLGSQIFKRGYASSVIRSAEAAAPGAATTVSLNFCTPHTPIYVKKQVTGILLPGEGGYFGVLPNKPPTIAQLKPGQVTIYHVGVSIIVVE